MKSANIVSLSFLPSLYIALTAAAVVRSNQGVAITPTSFSTLPPVAPQVIASITNLSSIQAEDLASGQKSSLIKSGEATGNPATPDGYNLIFGPTNAATVAPGFLDSILMDNYDIGACAQLCNSHAPDPNGGLCQFFNIFQVVSNGVPGQTTCAFYFLPTDASTATNTGTSPIQFAQSLGYARITYLPDGGFEDFTCSCCPGHPFCSTTSDATWNLVITGAPSGTASQILRLGGAHTGSVFATLGFFDSTNPGIWAPTAPIATVPSKDYVIAFFLRLTNTLNTGSLATQFAVTWNGEVVFLPRPTDFDWHFYQVQVTAIGNDEVRFKDDFPNEQLPTSEIDDIFIFLA